jgi:hypothetical protein
MPAKSHLKRVPPSGKKRAVAPVRRPNSEYRKREHLTPAEVVKLIEAAKGNRYIKNLAFLAVFGAGGSAKSTGFWPASFSVLPFIESTAMRIKKAQPE